VVFQLPGLHRVFICPLFLGKGWVEKVWKGTITTISTIFEEPQVNFMGGVKSSKNIFGCPAVSGTAMWESN